MGIDTQRVKVGQRVVHRGRGWAGTIEAVAGQNVQVMPAGSPGRPQWFDADEFDLAAGATYGAPTWWPGPDEVLVDPEISQTIHGGTVGPRRWTRSEGRYLVDAPFHHLVDRLAAAIDGGQVTAADLRDAVALATVVQAERADRRQD